MGLPGSRHTWMFGEVVAGHVQEREDDNFKKCIIIIQRPGFKVLHLALADISISDFFFY